MAVAAAVRVASAAKSLRHYRYEIKATGSLDPVAFFIVIAVVGRHGPAIVRIDEADQNQRHLPRLQTWFVHCTRPTPLTCLCQPLRPRRQVRCQTVRFFDGGRLCGARRSSRRRTIAVVARHGRHRSRTKRPRRARRPASETFKSFGLLLSPYFWRQTPLLAYRSKTKPMQRKR